MSTAQDMSEQHQLEQQNKAEGRKLHNPVHSITPSHKAHYHRAPSIHSRPPVLRRAADCQHLRTADCAFCSIITTLSYALVISDDHSPSPTTCYGCAERCVPQGVWCNRSRALCRAALTDHDLVMSTKEYGGTSRFNGAGPFLMRPDVS